MRFLILGRGASGRAAAALAARLGYETVTLDGADAFPEAGAFDGAIVSPGIPLDHPWQVSCRAREIPVKSELQFGCEALRRQGVRLLAVTGSKGKSSVVKLVADALNRVGRRAIPCGNYGRPVCDVAISVLRPPRPQAGQAASHPGCGRDGRSTGEDVWAVVEVSSFQLETTELPADTFEAAAILNLQEDHLDRHGSVEVYHALKRKLLAMAKRPFAFSDLHAFNLQPSTFNLLSGSYFDNEILRSNGAAAIFLLRAAGLDDGTIAEAFCAFEPLPHRMNVIGTFGGVTCIDDSKATSLAALAAGVRMVSTFTSNLQPSIRLIAGGLPKGDDPKDVLPILTERVRKVYLIGRSAEAFFAAWAASVACEICGTMERAVERALAEAAAGETLLLSPGTASFDQFKSFGERGDVFANLVSKNLCVSAAPRAPKLRLLEVNL